MTKKKITLRIILALIFIFFLTRENESAYLLNGKKDQALNTVKSAAAKFPKLYSGGFDKGVVLLCVGNEAEAFQVFSRSIAFTITPTKSSAEKIVYFDGAKEIKRMKSCDTKLLVELFDYSGRELMKFRDEYR